MATATRTFTFNSNAEGFVDNGDSTLTVAWSSGDGNPAGSLEFSSASGTDLSERARRSAESWETIFGIPASSTVTDVQVTGWDELTWDIGTHSNRRVRMRILDSAGAVSVHSAGELFDLTGAPTADGGTPHARGAGTSRAVDASYQASATTVRVEVQVDLTGTGSWDNEVDNLAIQITYTTGGGGATVVSVPLLTMPPFRRRNRPW